MQQLINASEFVESLALLVITALLTGILVPLIKIFFDYRNFQNQKLFEDRLVRQNNLLESQIEFLETISTLLWKFHALIAKVSYYQIHKPRNGYVNSDPVQSAIEVYEENFWELVIQNIQSDISRSRRLISPNVYNRLYKLYKEVIIESDKELGELLKKNASKGEWEDFHNERLKGELVSEINDAIYMLAEDMGLVKENN